MGEYRKEHLFELIKNLSGKFLSSESNLTSMVTVTRVEISPDEKAATIYISVFPEAREIEALHFAIRKRADLRYYLLKNIRTGRLPFLDIAIDKGEKLRNKIDEVIHDDKEEK